MPSRVALVVDDSMLIRHTVCRFLEDRGFVAEAASNGIEALEILKTVLPDVIITDLNMPKMDGHEFIGRLRAHAKTVGIPIVVLQGKGMKGVEEVDARADASVIKDVEIEAQLSGALRRVLEKSPASKTTVRAS